jgi:MarR family transcriptional regulator, lower aerobic nicotinate degradation pathway regulator
MTGGAIFGYCEIGNDGIATKPAVKTIRLQTAANIGRRKKNAIILTVRTTDHQEQLRTFRGDFLRTGNPSLVSFPSRPACDDPGGYPGALLACTDFVLSTLAVTVSSLLDAELEPLGLRMRQYRVLRILHEDGPQRQSALGAALGIDRTTTVQVIDELEAAGFVKRARSTDDRRQYVVTITPKGRRTTEKAIVRTAKAEATMYGPLSPSERSTLQELATRLLTKPGTIAEDHRREYDALVERRRS